MDNNKPNILWICADHQRFDTLNCVGNKYVNTPNLDRLAAMGVLFQNAYCQNPVCSPSRACFLTGRYPRTTRIRQNGQTIPDYEVLVTKMLDDNGYVCGLSGKLHLAPSNPKVNRSMEKRINDGYSAFYWSVHPTSKNRNMNWPTNEYDLWLAENGRKYEVKPYMDSKYVSAGMPVQYHQTTWCVNKAINFINACNEYKYPWLFSVNIFDPHHPFDPPKELLDRYAEKLDEIPLPNYVEGELENKSIFQKLDHKGAYNNPRQFPYDSMDEKDHKLVRSAFWAMIDLIDMQVGRLIKALEDSGQLENTMIIFTSDHGEMLGDHGIYLKGPHFYEGAVHVPLIISYPKAIKPGRVSTALVELIDLPETILDAAGLEKHPGMMGKSLWRLLTGEQQLNQHRDDVYCEYYNSMPVHQNPQAYATMIFDGRYKFIRYHSTNEGELYDLENDPNETNNLYENEDYLRKRLEMTERLSDRMAWTVDPLPEREAGW